MENIMFLSQSISFIFLLVLSCFTYILSKKSELPYTVLLLFVGLLLVPISNIPHLGFVADFKLTPEIVFYIFLPILIFEAAYNIKYRELFDNAISIGMLSIIGTLISTFVIGVFLFYLFIVIGFELPFLICLLFGSLISATDPVAVIAIFKKLGAPKRLTLIFEGESLFNDGVSVVVFKVILFGIIYKFGADIMGISLVFSTGIYFLTMVFGGIIFGALMGYLFSKMLGLINYNEEVEITLAIVSAYATFIIAEFMGEMIGLHISGIIATVISSIVIGNYGRYKITPKSEGHMNEFLEFFTYISNSIVFISLGLILSSVENISILEVILPIIVTIIVMVLARFISVYGVIGLVNGFKKEPRIGSNWKRLLFYGGLRGVIAIMMVLLIPGPDTLEYSKILDFQNAIGWDYAFSIRDFLIVLTISCISFTLLVQAPMISYIMKKMGLDELYDYEKIEHEEWKIISHLKILAKISKFSKNKYISKSEYKDMTKKYELELKLSFSSLNSILNSNEAESGLFVKRLIFKYALGIERNYLKDMFYYKKIDEKNFKYILRDIEDQIEKLDNELKNGTKIGGISESKCFLNLCNYFKDKYSDKDMYIIYRTRSIIGDKVVSDLKKIPYKDYGFDKELILKVINIYKYQNELFSKKKKELFEMDKRLLSELEKSIVNKTFLKLEQKLLDDLYKKEIIPPSCYNKFMEKIEGGLYKDL